MKTLFRKITISFSTIAIAASLISGIAICATTPSRVVNTPTVNISNSISASGLPNSPIIIRK